MNHYQNLLDLNLTVIENELIAKHTTYRIGGPARYFVQAHSYEDVMQAKRYATQNNLNVLVLGNGSNVLVSDNPYDGIVISTRKLNHFEVEGTTVIAQCGVPLIKLAYKTAELGLSGLEYASGIPGFIGGACYMNAGAYKSDTSRILQEVLVLIDDELLWLKKEDLGYAYRTSKFQKHHDWIILAARLELNEDNPETILQVIANRKEKREASQPWNERCAGSTFRNPEGYSSWELIDRSGLRGYEIGDAQVSLKHPNFLINRGSATALDVKNLIEHVKSTVKAKTDIELKTEVEFINW